MVINWYLYFCTPPKYDNPAFEQPPRQIVGIVSDVSTFWLDADLKIVVALATLVAVLLFRPQGVFGVKARTA